MRLTDNAIRYTISHLLRVAFPHSTPDIRIEGEKAVAQVEGVDVHFFIMDEKTADTLTAGTLSLQSATLPFGVQVPLYQQPDTDQPYRCESDALVLQCDLVTLPFLLLSRWEEYQEGNARDVHGRFCYAGSLNERYGCIDLPVADFYGLLLRSWVVAAHPDLHVQPRTPRCISTHDVDLIQRFGGWLQNVRTLGADLIKYHSVKLFRQSFRQCRAARKDRNTDPLLQACLRLRLYDKERQHDSLFFIKAQQKGEHDCGYDIRSAEAAFLVGKLRDMGAGIGLHGGLHAAYDPYLLATEKQRLEAVTGSPITAGRQHYLRFHPLQTQRAWQHCGLTDDYTLGFAEREGFRCGTCHPYPLYDLVNDCETTVIEHPLIAMDMTFIAYRKMQPGAALDSIQRLRHTCEQAEGDFVLLWHNTTVGRDNEQWFQQVFCNIE